MKVFSYILIFINCIVFLITAIAALVIQFQNIDMTPLRIMVNNPYLVMGIIIGLVSQIVGCWLLEITN